MFIKTEVGDLLNVNHITRLAFQEDNGRHKILAIVYLNDKNPRTFLVFSSQNKAKADIAWKNLTGQIADNLAIFDYQQQSITIPMA